MFIIDQFSIILLAGFREPGGTEISYFRAWFPVVWFPLSGFRGVIPKIFIFLWNSGNHRNRDLIFPVLGSRFVFESAENQSGSSFRRIFFRNRREPREPIVLLLRCSTLPTCCTSTGRLFSMNDQWQK